jgi:hypothetical protein
VQYVRVCSDAYPEACVGGVGNGDDLCADGHRGPLCEVCVKSPAHYGGRGKPCDPCSEAGDVRITLGLVLGSLFVALLVATIASIRCRSLVTGFLTEKFAGEDIQSQGAAHFEEARKPSWVSRCSQIGESISVKLKILISLWQVISELGDSYEIRFPPLYQKAVVWFNSLSLPISVTPFACVFPSLDTYLFDFILITGMPIAIVVFLMLSSTGLNAYTRRQQAKGVTPEISVFLSELASNLSFFVTFLVFPACSTTSCQFFAEIQFDFPGEDGSAVMRADPSVETSGAAYAAVRTYAFFMILVYPLGIPFMFFCTLMRSRHALNALQLLERTLAKRLELAQLQAEAVDTEAQGREIMKRAEDVHSASVQVYEELRGQLPTTVRRLTSGYELRTYWFESTAHTSSPLHSEPNAHWSRDTMCTAGSSCLNV